MSTLMIPDQLKNALRKRYSGAENRHITEKATEHEWSVSFGYSVWSGYHDEDDYYYIAQQSPIMNSTNHLITHRVRNCFHRTGRCMRSCFRAMTLLRSMIYTIMEGIQIIITTLISRLTAPIRITSIPDHYGFWTVQVKPVDHKR